MPDAIPSGRVSLQGTRHLPHTDLNLTHVVLAHDFFEPQPVQGAAVYLLQQALHDWSDEYCTTILRKLRDAADSSSKLIVVDKLVPFAVRGFQHSEDIPGLVKDQLPEPLPAIDRWPRKHAATNVFGTPSYTRYTPLPHS